MIQSTGAIKTNPLRDRTGDSNTHCCDVPRISLLLHLERRPLRPAGVSIFVSSRAPDPVAFAYLQNSHSLKKRQKNITYPSPPHDASQSHRSHWRTLEHCVCFPAYMSEEGATRWKEEEEEGEEEREGGRRVRTRMRRMEEDGG